MMGRRDMTESWPREEKYALTDHIRRYPRSVCSNIGEAWFKRRYLNHFIGKLSDAGSEAAETSIWIDFANACSYLANDEQAELEKTYDAISGASLPNHRRVLLTIRSFHNAPFLRLPDSSTRY